jgi:RNA polymerase sigma-70 factor (ECF subfamily)
MALLSEEQRICIELFYLKERSYKEITELTGLQFNEVKSYIQNGKRNLKIQMEKTLNEQEGK